MMGQKSVCCWNEGIYRLKRGRWKEGRQRIGGLEFSKRSLNAVNRRMRWANEFWSLFLFFIFFFFFPPAQQHPRQSGDGWQGDPINMKTGKTQTSIPEGAQAQCTANLVRKHSEEQQTADMHDHKSHLLSLFTAPAWAPSTGPTNSPPGALDPWQNRMHRREILHDMSWAELSWLWYRRQEAGLPFAAHDSMWLVTDSER